MLELPWFVPSSAIGSAHGHAHRITVFQTELLVLVTSLMERTQVGFSGLCMALHTAAAGAQTRRVDGRAAEVALLDHNVLARAWYEREVLTMCREAGLAPPASDHAEVLDGLTQARIPFARITPQSHEGVGLATTMDDIAAAREIADHVLGYGHRRIAIIKGDPDHPVSAQRLIAYRAAFDAAGVDYLPELIETGDWSFESGYEATKRILSRKLRPTAILAENDDMAVGAMSAARELGFDVPADLSVVGFDDSEIARVVWPRLTTVRQPVVEMAHTAADMLLRQLAGEDPGPTVIHTHRLIERLTVGPPPV